MRLYFLRHAQAEDGVVDEARRLTSFGRKQAKVVGGFLKKAGVGFNAVYSSPLVRARETAELVLRACGSSPELGLQTEPALQNEASQEMFDSWLADRKRVEHVLLVGHAPTLAARAQKILKAETFPALEFPTAGLLALEAVEHGDARILFFITPESLACLPPGVFPS